MPFSVPDTTTFHTESPWITEAIRCGKSCSLFSKILPTPSPHERPHRSFTFKNPRKRNRFTNKRQVKSGPISFFRYAEQILFERYPDWFLFTENCFHRKRNFRRIQKQPSFTLPLFMGKFIMGYGVGLGVFVLSGKFGLTTVDVFIISTRLRGTISACRLCLII